MHPCVCVVWVCVCSCVREFVYVDAYAHLCTHVWRSEVDIRCLSLLFSILFWDAVSHWTYRSLIKIDWLQAHRIFLSLSSWLWDYICTLPGPALCVGAGYLNPVPHACSATIRAFPPFYVHMTIHIVIGGHLLNIAQEYSIIILILNVYLSLLLFRCWIILDLVKMFWGAYNGQKFIFIAECTFGNYCCHLWLTLLNIHSRDMARPPLASFLFADLWMMLFVVGSMFCATRKYFWEGLLESDFLYVVVSWVVYFRNSF